jgi:ABC-2 type transport system ATP-binding protein
VLPALRIDGVTKRFGRLAALDDVTLTVEPGEVRGLLGPNGAGKTTLLRAVLGLVSLDGGTVSGNAHPVGGFVEDPAFYPYLTGRVNLELQAELDRGSGSERIDDVLARVGLAERAGERVGGYSSGMRQRLGIAAALLRAPRLLVLDEPTSALDPAGVEDVLSLLRQLAAAGVATLISSHQLDALDGLCDTYTVLDRGRVVWDGTAARRRVEAPPFAYRLRTSDDERARELALGRDLALSDAAVGLELAATEHELDGFVVALGAAGVAVRRLQPVAR